jgi:hypothetical protein
MRTETPHPVAAAVRLPPAPSDEGWRCCQGCGEEWHLTVAQGLCPECAEEERAERRKQGLLAWRRQHRDAVLAQAAVPVGLRREVSIRAWPRDPRQGGALDGWRGEPWCATLVGEPGVGKSTLAAALTYRWLCEDATLTKVCWRRGSLLLREMLQGRPEAEQARHCQLLILDDFGQGLGSTTAWGMLGEILAERHEWQRATLLTTNLQQPALEAGHCATADRILDGLLCPLRGGSRRGS